MDAAPRRPRRRSKAHEERVLVACACGQLAASKITPWLELPSRQLADLEAGRLHHSACKACGAELFPEHWVLLHDPAVELACLVVPDARRAQALEELRDYLDWLSSEGPETVPLYALHPEILFGSDGLEARVAALVESKSGASEAALELARERADEERRTELSAERSQLEALGARLEEQAAELEGRRASLEQREQELGQLSAGQGIRAQEQAQWATELEERALDVGRRQSEVVSSRDALNREAAELDALQALLEAERVDLEALEKELARQREEQRALGAELSEQARQQERREAALSERAEELAAEAASLAEERHRLSTLKQDLQDLEAFLAERARALQMDGEASEPGEDGHAARRSTTAGLFPRSPDAAPAHEPAALDIELVQTPSAPASTPDSGAFVAGAPLPELDAVDGGPSALEQAVAELPLHGKEPEALRGVEALAEPGFVASSARAEDPDFLEGVGWTEELDRAWDLETAGVPVPEGMPASAELAPAAAGAPPAEAEDDEPAPEAPAVVAPAEAQSSPTPVEPEIPAAVAEDAAALAELATASPAAGPVAGGEQAATRRFRIEDIRPEKPGDDEVQARVRSQHAAPVGPFDHWDATLALGGDRYATLRDGEVYLCLRAEPGRLAEILESHLDLGVQLHMVDAGAAVVLSLVAVEEGGDWQPTAHWILDHRHGSGEAALRALARSFRPSVVLFDEGGLPVRLLRFERLLEANVAEILEMAALWDEGRDVQPAAIEEALAAPDFDRLGRKQHPFGAEAFARIDLPSQALFALGVLAYWLEPENRDYLVFVKSFPLEQLDDLVRRILRAGVGFGLCLPERLEKEALRLGLAGERREILTRSLANFAEVCLRIKPYDLDELQEWQNWEALLTRCEDLGVDVDDDIVKLAERSMQRIQLLTQDGTASLAEVPAAGDEEVTLITSGLMPELVAYPEPLAAAAELSPPPVAEGYLQGGSGPAWAVAPDLPPLAPAPVPPGPDAAALADLLRDDALARDATDALVALGPLAAQELLRRLLRLSEGDHELAQRYGQAFGRIGEPALAELLDEGSGGPALRPALFALAEAVGPAALRQRLQARGRADLAGLLDAPPVPPPPPAETGTAGEDGASGRLWTGELETLLGVELGRGGAQPGRARRDESGEILIGDDDILEEIDAPS